MRPSISSKMAGLASPEPHAMEPEKGNPEPDGQIGHKLMMEAHEAEPDSKHMHIQHDGMTHTTHHVGHDGKVEGPHDHENMEAVKSHMDKFFNEEQHEGSSGHESSGHELFS